MFRQRADGGLVLLAVLLGALLVALFSHDRLLRADGIEHYVYLRSLWVGHDLDLADDYEAVTRGRYLPAATTPLGRTANVHPVGPAILWAPFYGVADVITRLRGGPADGVAKIYRDAVSVGSLFYGWLGLVLLYRTVRRLVGGTPALLATLGIALGTFLYWYLVQDPTMAHAGTFAAAALVVWLWLRPTPTGIRRALCFGAAVGLAALLRWQAAMLFILVIAEAVERLRRREPAAVVARDVLLSALAAAAVFSPQMIVFKQLYGSWLTIPQGAAFVSGVPAWSGVLFSPRHGLFSWSPFLYLGIAGWLLWLRRNAGQAIAALVVFGACVRLNAGVADWWGGAAFGGRRFDLVLPLFGVATGFFLRWVADIVAKRPGLATSALVGAFAVWNLLLAAGFRSGLWDHSDPVTFDEMGRGATGTIDRRIGSPFSLPGALWERWARGRPLADYESLFTHRAFARWSARFGFDERVFLEDGWSETRTDGGVSYRSLDGEAGLVVPLHQAAAYRFGVRARTSNAEGASVRLLVNGRPAGVSTVPAAWSDHEWSVPAEALRPGRNFLRLRVIGGAAAVDVTGAWMAPERQ